MRVKCVIMCKFSRSNLNYTGKSCHVLIVSYEPCALNTSVHLCCELCVGIVIFFPKPSMVIKLVLVENANWKGHLLIVFPYSVGTN